MSSPDENICPKCAKPKKQTAQGSMTQWIFACDCNVVRPEQETSPEPIYLCKNCGKRITTGRSGSFTQWVFRSNICECETPQPGEVAQEDCAEPKGSFSEYGTDKSHALENLDTALEAELQLDPSYFPTDRYKALSEIGHGAAGNVYLCRDRLLGTRVAVKCLRHISGEQLIAFQQEAKATSSLSHQNIVKIYNFGVTDNGAPYMVMEYIEGISLEQFVRQFGPLSTVDALELAEVLADALSYAHSKRIFHRDIKSSNVIIARYDSGNGSKNGNGGDDEGSFGRELGVATIEPDSVHLIDFGVAMIKHANQEPTIVQGQTVVGTPAYMPPDQAQGKTYDERSEIYALGCALFEALTGSTPFQGETALEIIGRHANEDPPTVSSKVELQVELQEAESIDELISTCLAKDQSNRFQTMQEFKDKCRDILNQLSDQPDSDTDDDTTSGADSESQLIASASEVSRNEPRRGAVLKSRGTKIAFGIAAITTLGCLVPVIKWATEPTTFVLHHSQISVLPTSLTSKTLRNDAREERAEVVRKLIDKGKATAFVNMDEYLSAYSWDDVDLKPFQDCKGIISIDLSNNLGITEKGMRYLDKVALRQLNLTNTGVNDLTQLPRCEETLDTLKLGQNKTSHRSLQSLARFKYLSRIVFSDSTVTPDDLRFLALHLPLTDITAYDCRFVKKADVDAIQKEFPYMRFNYQGMPGLSLLERDVESTDKLKQEKRFAECLRIWQDWEKRAPQFKDPHKKVLSRSLALQTEIYSLLANRAKADETMARAIAVADQFGDRMEKLLVYDRAFSHYYGTMQVDKAIAVGLQNQKLHAEAPRPANARPEALLAYLLAQKGRYEEAKPLLVHSNQELRNLLNTVRNLETVPNQVGERSLLIDNLNCLAKCYEKTGEPKKARKCLAERDKLMASNQVTRQNEAPQALPTKGDNRSGFTDGSKQR